MSKENETKKKETETESPEEEEYLVKYKSGPTTSTTQQGNIYNITVQIGQSQPPPPYRP